MPLALDSLPSELLDQIILSLVTEPPSIGQLHRNPDRCITQSPNKDLKNLAQCSHRLLHIVRHRLFAHACLDLKDESRFKDFILESNLARHVQSLVVIGGDICINQLREPWWHRIFSYLDPTRVTILAPPLFIGNTLNTPIEDADGEAFDIHFQAVQLEREGTPDVTAFPQLDNCTLLRARPWASMTFNESSFLKAYDREEYYLLRVPSILREWSKELITNSLSSPVSTMLRELTSFSYVAAFPFYNHVQAMLDVMSRMPNLQALSVRLAPKADDQDPRIQWPGVGQFDFHPSWGELATAYSLIIFEVLQKPSLVEFRSYDCTLDRIGERFFNGLNTGLEENNWAVEETGLWRRRRYY